MMVAIHAPASPTLARRTQRRRQFARSHSTPSPMPSATIGRNRGPVVVVNRVEVEEQERYSDDKCRAAPAGKASGHDASSARPPSAPTAAMPKPRQGHQRRRAVRASSRGRGAARQTRRTSASWFSIERKTLAGVSSRTCCAYALHASPTTTGIPIKRPDGDALESPAARGRAPEQDRKEVEAAGRDLDQDPDACRRPGRAAQCQRTAIVHPANGEVEQGQAAGRRGVLDQRRAAVHPRVRIEEERARARPAHRDAVPSAAGRAGRAGAPPTRAKLDEADHPHRRVGRPSPRRSAGLRPPGTSGNSCGMLPGGPRIGSGGRRRSMPRSAYRAPPCTRSASVGARGSRAASGPSDGSTPTT